MNSHDFYTMLDGKRQPFMLPGSGKVWEYPANFIARYNQSVNHLNSLSDEVRAALALHTELEKEQNSYTVAGVKA